MKRIFLLFYVAIACNVLAMATNPTLQPESQSRLEKMQQEQTETISNGQWRSIGPEGGFIKHLCQSDGEIYAIAGYTGLGDALYRSVNNGLDWEIVVSSTIPGYKTTIKKVGPSLFLGTSSSGIYRSDDNGITWSKKSSDYYINFIEVHGSVFLAGTMYGMLRSTDNGNSWVSANNGFPVNDATIWTVTNFGNDIFAGLGENYGVYKSSNSGETWTLSSGGLQSGKSDILDYYPSIRTMLSTGGDLYAGTEYAGIYKSSDGGVSWQLTNDMTLDYGEFRSLAADGTNIFALSWLNGVLKSENQGATWNEANNGIDIFAESNSLIAYNDQILVGTKSGIFCSTDQGANYFHFHNGIKAHQIASPAVIELDGKLFTASRSGGIFRSNDGGNNWENINGSLPINGGIPFFFATDGRVLFAYDQMSNDGGDTWFPHNSPGDADQIPWIKQGNYLFTSHVYNGVFRSADNGSTWQQISSNINASVFATLHTDGSNLLLGTFSGAFTSPDNGNTWLQCSLPETYGPVVFREFINTGNSNLSGPVNFGNRGIYRSTDNCVTWVKTHNLIAFKFVQNGSKIYVSGTNLEYVNNVPTEVPRILMSNDDGLTWNMISGGVGSELVLFSLLAEGTNVYIGSTSSPNYGIYFTANDGQNWINAGMDIYPKTLLSSFVNAGDKLYAGTMGSSLLSVELNAFYTPSQPSSINGLTSPCIGSIQTYSVESQAGTQYVWQFPTGWEIQGENNLAQISVLVGENSGAILVFPTNFAGNGPAQIKIVEPVSKADTPEIYELNETLYSSASVGNQWIMDGVAIQGATNSSYTPIESGLFSVVVKLGDCVSDTSNSIGVLVGIFDNKQDRSLVISPNPTTGDCLISYINSESEVVRIKIYDSFGSQVFSQKIKTIATESKILLNLEKLKPGLYFVELDRGTTFQYGKLIKIK